MGEEDCRCLLGVWSVLTVGGGGGGGGFRGIEQRHTIRYLLGGEDSCLLCNPHA